MQLEIDALTDKPGYIRFTITTDAGDSLSVDYPLAEAEEVMRQGSAMIAQARRHVRDTAKFPC